MIFVSVLQPLLYKLMIVKATRCCYNESVVEVNEKVKMVFVLLKGVNL